MHQFHDALVSFAERREIMMKKLLLFALAGIVPAVLLTGCGGGSDSKTADAGEVVVYNWGEYISNGEDGRMDVSSEFEKETGITVNYTTYETNE